MAGNEAPKKLIASIVLNGVAGDSRVIKTTKAAEEAGYRAILFGLGDSLEPQELDVEGTKVILVRNPVLDLKKRGLWSPAHKPFRLMVEMAAEAIAAEVQKVRPDLVHSHDMLGLKVGSVVTRALAAHGRPVPWVHDLHEYVAGLTTLSPESVALFVEYERLYLRQTDHLITVSPALADVVTSRYKLATAPTVVLNAPAYQPEFEVSAPDVKSALGLGRDKKLVVYVGGAKEERGCRTIVEAVASLPDVHLCFVSNSDRYIGTLRTLAESLGMGARFHTHPYVASDQVTTFIRTADVGTHGLIHYPNGEVALPNKLFEYLQAGVPMALSDVASMKGFLEEHGVGRVFEAGNARSCALAIDAAFADGDDIRDRMTVDMKQRYSWQTQAQTIGQIYRPLLAGREKQNALVVDDNAALEICRAENPDMPIIYAGSQEPSAPVAMRIDPVADREQGGIATMIASRFSSLRFYNSPAWPGIPAMFALGTSGVRLSASGRSSDTRKLVFDALGSMPSASAQAQQDMLLEYDMEVWGREHVLRSELHATLFSVFAERVKEGKAVAPRKYGKLLAPYKKLKRAFLKLKSNR